MKNDPSYRKVSGIFHAALKAVNPYELIKEHIDQIRSIYREGDYRKLYVISFGKAAYSMTKAVADLADDLLTEGIMVTKYGHVLESGISDKIAIFEAAHPLPDFQGVLATEKIIALLEEAERQTLVVCLISGGGSALLVAPHKDISLSEKQEVTRLLLKAGANIHELNTVRKHLSRIKGGRLAEIAYPATVLSLILSDVIGDPLDVIASGPTAPDQTTFRDALKVINFYGLGNKIPEKARLILVQGTRGEISETPKEGNPVFARVQNIIVGNNIKAIEAAKKEAEGQGYQAIIISTELKGEARDVAVWLADKAIEASQKLIGESQGKICLISGGETTVIVLGNGLGGRNMELALAFAQEIKGKKGIILLSAGTDGTDGPTDAAGAIVDGRTIDRAETSGVNPQDYLKNNDSYNFFKATGGLFITGPTGVNVMDLQIILID
ncbi:MAG TPA: glycerate kinase [Syntrophales bacterium]|nr:glycerate kinase [Syntrophales bacterium]